MKNIILNILFGAILFIASSFITYVSFFLNTGGLVEGLTKGMGSLSVFVFILLIYFIALKYLRKRMGIWAITLLILIPIILFIFPKALNSSLKFSLKFIPYYISIILGFLAGYYLHSKSKKRLLIPILLALFPLVMLAGVNNLWVHKIEYGTFSGEVSNGKKISYEMSNKAGEIISDKSLEGKYVLFDFWYRTCRPCWVKFPKLQQIYDSYSGHPEVAIYAVNRPMDWDKPGQLYSSIEKKDYTFPVLAGNQEIMDAFEVYVYPTVVLMDKEGTIIFMGEIEDAEEKLEELLSANS